MVNDFKVLGKATPLIDGALKATGQARYTADLHLPGMLYGKILRSPYPHARILNIDVSRAKKLVGVKAVITHADTPGVKFGPVIDDWYILAKDKVRFIGEEVAAVAAVDEDTAIEALDLIKVEYEPLPAVFDPEEALEPGAPIINEGCENNLAFKWEVDRGDFEAALREADVVVEDTFSTSQVYQAYLEPMCGVAYVDDNGRYVLFASTQVPSKLRFTYSKGLGVSMQDIRVIKPMMGGGFGAKFETALHPIAMLLARKSGRPVKIVNERDEDFMAGNPRVPMKIFLRIGFKKDGTILAKEAKVIAGNGGRTVYGPPILSTACYRTDQLYRFTNIKTRGYLAYTNTVPTGCFRGFGNAQMTFALESLLDEAAEELGMDPADLRLRNAVQDGHLSPHGWYIPTSGLSECIRRATQMSGWKDKRASAAQGPVRRGIGLACCNHVSGNRPFFRPFDGASAIIRIGEDGKILLIHGECDMGQGQDTVFAMLAAETLGAKLEDVRVSVVDTDISPFGLGSFATRGTTIGGHGVVAAAKAARAKLFEAAAELLQAEVQELDACSGTIFVASNPDKAISIAEAARHYMFTHGGGPIVTQGTYVPDTQIPDENKYGNPSPVYPFGCQVAEVEVDTETGLVRVVELWAVHDVGRALNPMALEGQIHGGAAMGIGWALTENMVTVQGKVENAGFMDYRIPGSRDLPRFHVGFVETNDPKGPYGAKGIGEPALNPTAAAVANAICNAIGARITSLPITPEKVLAALRGKRKD